MSYCDDEYYDDDDDDDEEEEEDYIVVMMMTMAAMALQWERLRISELVPIKVKHEMSHYWAPI